MRKNKNRSLRQCLLKTAVERGKSLPAQMTLIRIFRKSFLDIFNQDTCRESKMPCLLNFPERNLRGPVISKVYAAHVNSCYQFLRESALLLRKEATRNETKRHSTHFAHSMNQGVCTSEVSACITIFQSFGNFGLPSSRFTLAKQVSKKFKRFRRSARFASVLFVINVPFTL